MLANSNNQAIGYATLAAAAAAITVYYVFEPTIFPSEDSTPRHNAVGLSNPANDCFINSVLQALAASDKLRQYLRTRSEDGEIVNQALSLILDRLRDPTARGQTISAKRFIHELENAYQSRLSRQQQDAQEFLQLLLERIVEESGPKHKRASDTNTAPRRSSYVPVVGKLDSEVECLTCHFSPPSVRSDFLTLSLPVPQSGSTNLNACLDVLLKGELVDGYVCAKCRIQDLIDRKEREASRTSTNQQSKDRLLQEVVLLQGALQNATDDFFEKTNFNITDTTPRRRIHKFTYIADYPEVLVIHLSRSIYGWTSSKNTAKVAFPKQLRIGFKNVFQYELVSFITHRGGHNRGHYETFRQKSLEERDGETSGKSRDKDDWWGISDHRVKTYSNTQALAMQQGVYLLVYERR